MINGYAGSLKMFPQEKVTVNGIVKDEMGVPMIGVTIVEEGTTNGVFTDFDGKFSISVNDGAALLISFMGYRGQTVENLSAESGFLEISMELDVSNLDEVVVVGYGKQKKESVVAAISQIDGEEVLKTGATTNVSEALQGLMPGLTVINSDGLPGKGAHDIMIRGVGTTSGYTYPLVIVDGIERDFNMIDPSEIETISVLKDASATAVYGVRGANGVIMITTKRGRTGDPKFNFSSNFGFKKPTKVQQNADFITTMRLYNEAAANDRLWDNLIPESEIRAWEENMGQAGPYNPYFPQIDWWDVILKDHGFQQQYNLNVSGGTESMRYFGSLGYVSDGDIFNTDFGKNSDFEPDFGFKRYNWRFNLDFDITRTTLFSVNFAGNFRKRFQPVFGPDDGSIFSRMRTLPTNTFPLRYPDGEWGDSPSGGQNYVVILNEGGQEIHKDYEGFYDARIHQKLDFITEGLSVEGKISLTSLSGYYSEKRRDRSDNPNASLGSEVRYYRDYDITNPIVNADGSIEYPLLSEIRWPNADYQGGKPIQSSYDEFRRYRRQLFYQFSANYQRKFGKHAITALALMNRQTSVNTGASVQFDFPSYREDWVGRFTYSYANKYLMEVNGAYSGSEKFAPGKRYGFFPSFAVGWVLSKESFFKKLTGDVFDLLKVRYSQGEQGSDRDAVRFGYTQLYTSGGNIPLGYDSRTNYGPLYQEGDAADPNATWETSLKRNLGIELEVLDKRLSATLDFYNEERTGILMRRRTIPVWFGNSVPSSNLGEAKNQGYEFALNWRDNIGEDFSYRIGGNITQLDTRIVFYDDPRLRDDYLKDAGKPIRWDRQAPRLINSGYYGSLDDIYNYAAPSVGASRGQLVPGDLMYVDYNADGIVDNQDNVAMENQLYPKMTYGFNFGVQYKNLSLNALFYGVSDIGRTIGHAFLWDYQRGDLLAHPDVASRWTPETADTAGKPSLHIGDNVGHNATASTYQYVDGDYLRLKNLELSYTIKAAVKSFNIDKLQLYANGNNLWTWVKNDIRTDPEAFGGSTYPVVKRYNIGLRLSF
ncbi:SusC/RagA family TonB-linked outer membrane protein [Sinomicrobium soli]|uniref:SusC/RagA family TonB-linked outer membrane protein n=1 Tax=Sinomicrobium sp. N-1-3-6 TaxID=2219864 RepID=UPI001374F92A|nr:TonB-dependent receptor [Sinomicrobium sp. N-1-3-6]